MDGKLTVEHYGFIVNLIQCDNGVCIYSAGEMFTNEFIFVGRCY